MRDSCEWCHHPQTEQFSGHYAYCPIEQRDAYWRAKCRELLIRAMIECWMTALDLDEGEGAEWRKTAEEHADRLLAEVREGE